MNKITKLLEKHVPFLRRIYFIDKNDTIAEQDECEDNYKQLLLSVKKKIFEYFIYMQETHL